MLSAPASRPRSWRPCPQGSHPCRSVARPDQLRRRADPPAGPRPSPEPDRHTTPDSDRRTLPEPPARHRVVSPARCPLERRNRSLKNSYPSSSGVPRARKEIYVGRSFGCGAAWKMRVLAPRSRPVGGGFKPPPAALAEDRRGERGGKGAVQASGRDREGVASQPVKCRKGEWSTSKPGHLICSGMSLAVTHLLARWCPAYRRRELDLRLSRGTWEGGADTAARVIGRREGAFSTGSSGRN
jgi:hypothetical protein